MEWSYELKETHPSYKLSFIGNLPSKIYDKMESA